MADGVDVGSVVKSFGGRRVLTDVDLSVEPGTMAAVLGPSGCGKTTLLRIIAGFTDADAGSVAIGGRPVAGVPTHRRRVGLLPQEGALFPQLSVGENVAFGVPRGDRRRVAGRVAHWLDVVGLVAFAEARPHELSGGQQQRVALARALAAEPRVVLLDEPFTALDAGLRVRVREDITEILKDTGTTAVLVTHDQAEALSLADRVALLLDGGIAQSGSPTEIYTRPASLAAARFVGATVEVVGDRTGSVVRSALGAQEVLGSVADGPVTVVLRPEQLRLVDEGVPGFVTAVRYYGADTSLRVVLRDGSRLHVRMAGDATVATGEAVTIGVDGPVLAFPVSPA